MGMEVCTTLGMLSPEQAKQLKEAYVLYLSDSTNAENTCLAQRPHCIQS
jgi:biotin synthase-like enzyme